MRIHVRSIKTAADAVPEPKNNKRKESTEQGYLLRVFLYCFFEIFID